MWGRVPTALASSVTATLPNLRGTTAPLPLSLSANRYARLAPSSALLSTQDTTILATTAPAQPGRPLVIDFRAKAAAVGIIPGTWTRRELKPALKETLTARLIDRSLRPVTAPAQICVSILAARCDSPLPLDALAVNAAAAALAGAETWPGPIAAARVALVDGAFVPFPSDVVAQNANFSVFVAMNEHERILTMTVDNAKDVIPERIVGDGVSEAIRAAAPLITTQRHFREQVLELREREGTSSFPRQLPVRADTEASEPSREDLTAIQDYAGPAYERAFVQCREFPGKAHRAAVVTETQQGIVEQFPHVPLDHVLEIADRAAREAYRKVLIRDSVRIDGRDFGDVRPIRVETSVLPGDVHGSAIFERGDTQVLACSTIGLRRQSIQTEEYVDGGENKPFFIHYSFPPYATGEYGRYGGPSNRREIGHSALAESAIEPLLSAASDEYPYALRLSAEVMGSDGSSSMATVCAGSLALLDAGAPLREPVAGVAMGLISEANEGEGSNDDQGDIILTDILGAEDHFGDMDMKVTGTRDGITACQLDTKRAEGLSLDVIMRTFTRAKHARESILDEMDLANLHHQRDMPDHAPRVLTIPVNPIVAIQTMMKDRAAGLREVEAQSGANLIFDGQRQTMTIEAPNRNSAELARMLIAQRLNDLEIGMKLEATVAEVKRSYALVELASGVASGILHVSKMQTSPVRDETGDDSDSIPGLRYPDAREILTHGETVEVVVLESDRARNVLRFGLVSPPRKTSRVSLHEEIGSVLRASGSDGSR